MGLGRNHRLDLQQPAGKTLDQAISKAQEKSSVPAILSLTAAVISCVLGLGLTLLFYLFVLHETSFDGTALISTARLQLVTAITQALTTCVTRAIPIIVSIYAYSMASEWLRLSQLPDSSERPTALHLGLLMTVVQGATRSYEQSARSVPGILKRSIWVIGSLLLLSYLTAAFDTWLHVSIVAQVARSEQPYSSSDISFGKQLNESRCAYYAAQNSAGLDPLNELCGLLLPSTSPIAPFDLSASSTEVTLTLANSSSSNIVQFTNDQHAILAPANIPARIAYNASSIGVKSQCRSLTRQCLDSSAVTGSFPSFHCPGFPAILVNNTYLAMYPDLSGVIFGVSNTTGGISSSSSDQFAFQATTTNPFQLVTVQMSQMFTVSNSSQSQFLGDSGFFYAGSAGGNAYNLLVCDVAVRKVAYEYRDMSQGDTSNPIPTFTTQSYWMSDIRTTQLMATMLDTALVSTPVVVKSIGAAIEPGNGYEEIFAQVLSTSLIAGAAPIFAGMPATSIISLNPVLVTRLPLISLIGFSISIALILMWTIAISLNALLGSRSIPLTHLAQMRLTSPQTPLHHFLPQAKSKATWSSNSTKLFGNEREEDGLAIGYYPSPDGTPTFGIGRAGDTQLLDSSSPTSRPSHPRLTKNRASSPSVSMTENLPKPGNGRHGLPLGILSISIALAVSLLSLIVLLLVYILSANQAVRLGKVLQTTATLSYILAATQLISTLMSLAVAPAMGLHAFHVASVWVDDTQASKVPLPSELCRLYYIVQGASLWSFVQQHFLKRPPTRGSRWPQNFRMVTEAMYLLGCLLLVSNLAAVVDNWFHISSSTYPTTSYTEYQPSNQTLFGKQVDFDRCSQYAASTPSPKLTPIRQLCGILDDDGIINPTVVAEAQQAWSNMSATNRIAITQDQHAILVPANLPVGVRFQATTIGLQATCESITRECVDVSSEQNQNQWSSWGMPWFNCSGSLPININNTNMEAFPWIKLFGILNTTTGDIIDGSNLRAYEVVESSPLPMVMASSSLGAIEVGNDTSYFTESGFAYWPGALRGWQLLRCNLAINEVHYQYDDQMSTFTTLSARSAPVETIKMIMASTDNEQMTNVVGDLASLQFGGGDYPTAYARQLSSILLSDAAFAFSAVEAEMIWRIDSKLGSQIQIVPLAMFLALTGLFCFIVTLILLRTAYHWNASSVVRSAHDRLMSPLPIVLQLFGPLHAMKLQEGSEVRQRLEESDENRLNIGPLDNLDGRMFTVFKASNREDRYCEGKPWASTWKTLPGALKAIPVLEPRADHGPSTEKSDNDDDFSSVMTFYLPATEPDVARRRSPYQSNFSSRANLVDYLTTDWS